MKTVDSAAASSQTTSFVSFIVIFAVLLVVAECLLYLVDQVQEALWFALQSRAIEGLAADVLLSVANGVMTFLAVAGLFIAIEWRQLGFSDFRKRYQEGIIFSVTALTISILVQGSAFYLLRTQDATSLWTASDLGPFLVIFPLVYLLILGFMEYWLHRALHFFDFLWRFHAIHHQIERLNAARSYSHFGQDILYIMLITIPLVLWVDAPQPHIMLVTTFYIISNYYMHSDAPALSFPAPLRHIIADNVYHHQHHTRDTRHIGKNYASFFSFFDRIFGTQYMPANGEFPETGIDGYVPLRSWRDYIFRPFRREH
ncbi:MAG: sterol desaturase family protein [Parasphingorhabdus sp.]|uniref:sterol desaturase family protein n=1 Tax=Parasphingorhabdus sp. TaxID=2709688 RepID=UPI0032970C10